MSTAKTWNLDQLLARKEGLASIYGGAPPIVLRLRELRAWQAARLARTYRDLLSNPRLAPAIEFFLSDVYGPQDFTHRDRDVARAWRYFKHALPDSVLEILQRAIELEVLTAELDHAMVAALPPREVGETEYAHAYRRVGQRDSRERQIDLVCGIGTDLQRIVRRKWIGVALRAAHRPAHTAGFGVLQDFLERGYDAFIGMQDSLTLVAAIRERETRFMTALLSDRDDPFDRIALRGADSHA